MRVSDPTLEHLASDSDVWRLEPILPAVFPVGSGPFRVRGLAYLTALEYVDKRLPGGRAALAEKVGSRDPWAPYWDQFFVVGGDYDISPLVRLFVGVAQLKGVSPASFIVRRSQSSAKTDIHGMWKPLLKTSSPRAMAERLPIAFNRYFQPCEAKLANVEEHRFEADLVGMPLQMAGLHVSSTEGFVSAALGLAGARDVHFSLEPPVLDGRLSGVALTRTKLIATWA